MSLPAAMPYSSTATTGLATSEPEPARPLPGSTSDNGMSIRSSTLDSNVADQCRQMVESIQLPRPLTMHNLIQSVATQLGVRIRAHGQSLTDPEVSGLIAQKKSGLIIVSWPQDYEKTHPWWTALCVGHELGHLMCNHLAKKPQYNRCQIGASVADNDDEAAAEYFGTLLAERIEAHETSGRRRLIDLRNRDNSNHAGRDSVAGNFTRLLRG